jgi:hypothetical protein
VTAKAKEPIKSPLGRDPLAEKRSSRELRILSKDHRIRKDNPIDEEVFLVMPRRPDGSFPPVVKAVWERMFHDHDSAKSFLKTYKKMEPKASRPFRIYRALIRVTDQYGD